MRLWRPTNEDADFVSMALVPWFVPANQNPLDMGLELRQRLKEKPNDTFCLLAIEDNVIQAMLIAYIQKKNVWLWQAHARDDFKYGREMFNGLRQWAKAKNCCKIKCKVSNPQNEKLYERKYGFKHKNKEMYLNVA